MAFIALGVTGGIGAYKAVEIARGLQKQGHDVVAIMSRSARRFVQPLTFEAITRREVITDQWKPGANARIEHIDIASTVDVLLVAPATANTIGKFAHGIADDFLSSMYLATTAPVVLAPAMNSNMFTHPAVVENLRLLTARGVHIVDPGSGYLACGWIGKGRLAEPEDVVLYVQGMLGAGARQSLAGKRVLVTAGPTYEDIDPVRYIGNRSSGRMGVAIAAEAARRGASVTLVSGPSGVPSPANVTLVPVRSASDMHAAVMSRAAEQDLVVMAAAVADYTLAAAPQKIAKSDGPLTLTLERTRDILADLGALLDIGPGQEAFGLGAVEVRVYAFDVFQRLADLQPARQHRHIGDEGDLLHQRLALAARVEAQDREFALEVGQTEQGLQGGGLTGAVGTDETDDAAGFDGEIDAVQDFRAGVTLGQAACGDECGHDGSPSRVSKRPASSPRRRIRSRIGGQSSLRKR